jgi:hypothetical protein
MAKLDPQQRAREYRQKHRDDGWTRNEKQKLKQLERKANRAERLASQPDQTSPMEVVDTLPDPTSEYLGRSLVQRAPGGFRSSVNTAIQLADDSIAWAEMVMEDPPVPTGFAFLRTGFTSGTIFPTSISHTSTGDFWLMDQGDSQIYHVSSTLGLISGIGVISTFGSPGGSLIGGVDVASDNVFVWFYNQGSTSPGNKAYTHNADGSLALSWTTPAISALHASGEFIAVALNASRSVIFLTDPQGNEIERYSNAGTHGWAPLARARWRVRPGSASMPPATSGSRTPMGIGCASTTARHSPSCSRLDLACRAVPMGSSTRRGGFTPTVRVDCLSVIPAITACRSLTWRPGRFWQSSAQSGQAMNSSIRRLT